MGRTRRLRYRHLRRTIIAAPLAVFVLLLLVLGAWRALESEWLRTAVARHLERVALRATGLELEIEELGWQLLPPRLVVSRSQLSGDAVKLEIDRAAVDIGGLWMARRTLVLDSIEVRGVKAELLEPPQSPGAKRSGGGLRVVVRNLDVRDVELVGQQLPGGLGAVLSGLQLSWRRDGGVTTGYASVKKADVDVPGLRNFEVAVDARFSWLRDELEIGQWVLRGGGLDLRGSTVLERQRVTGKLAGSMELSEIDRIVKIGDVLAGPMSIEGDFDTERDPILQAEVRTRRVTVEDLPLEDFFAEVDLSSDRLFAIVRRGRFFGGALRGTYALERIGPPFPHRVEATCDGLSLAPLLEALGVPAAGLAAHGDVVTSLSWNSDHFPKGVGSAEVALVGIDGPLPVEGDLTITLMSGALQFRGRDLQMGSSVIDLDGPLTLKTWEPAWSIHADPGYLEEIIPAVNQWIGSEALPEVIAGHGAVDVNLVGPWQRLRVGLRLEIEEPQYPPIILDRMVVEAEISEGACRVEEARYRLGSGSGEVSGVLRWASGDVPGELDLRVDGRRLSLEKVARWIDLESTGTTGEASFTGGLRGNPELPQGSWAVGIAELETLGQEVGNGSARLELEDGAFSLRNLEFDRGLGGHLKWTVFAETISGNLSWQDMHLAMVPAPLDRIVGRVFDWQFAFDWPLRVGPSSGELAVKGDTGRLDLAFSEDGLWASADLPELVSGRVEINTSPDSDRWQGTGTLKLESMANFADRMAPEIGVPIMGSMAAAFELDGRELQLENLSGTLADVDLDLGGRPISLVSDRGFRWGGAGFQVAGIEAAMDDDEIFFRGRVDPQGALSGNFSGTVDSRLLRVVIPEWEPAGRATGVVELLGDTTRPLFEGIVKIEGGSFRLPDTRTVIGDVNGTLFLSGGEVGLEAVDFRFMRGDGQCRGTIRVEDGLPKLVLRGAVSGLEYPLFPGFSPRLGGSWALEGPVDNLELSGDLLVERGELRRRDDLPSLLVDWFGEETPTAEDTLRLNLRIRADDNLVSRSPFLRLQGGADLHITGTDARPGLTGKVEFLEGGEVNLQGIRYELERGQITFADPTRIDPMLAFQARASIREYEVWLRLNGTLDRLVPSVSSDPPLSQPEIYSLMAVGTVGEGQAGGAFGLTLASSMLSRQLNQALESRELWLLPVDQIRVDPYVESATGDPSARVTVVKQLSPSVTVTLQSNLSGETDQVISARWYVGSGFFVEASRDNDGNLGLDFKLRRRY